jgi:hypothetical protein
VDLSSVLGIVRNVAANYGIGSRARCDVVGPELVK